MNYNMQDIINDIIENSDILSKYIENITNSLNYQITETEHNTIKLLSKQKIINFVKYKLKSLSDIKSAIKTIQNRYNDIHTIFDKSSIENAKILYNKIIKNYSHLPNNKKDQFYFTITLIMTIVLFLVACATIDVNKTKVKIDNNSIYDINLNYKLSTGKNLFGVNITPGLF